MTLTLRTSITNYFLFKIDPIRGIIATKRMKPMSIRAFLGG